VAPDATLYRCRTPTDWLCACGRVARELRKRGIEHETVRLAAGKAHRAPVEELTGQRHVPVLLLGDEAIADSKRIVEHLRWRDAAA
jgi:glutathione S-transferase